MAGTKSDLSFQMSMVIIMLIPVLLFVAAFAFLKQPKFSKLPSGQHLERIRRSENYKNDHFRNRSDTPMFTAGAGLFTILKEFLFDKKKGVKSASLIPSRRIDLLNLDSAKDILVWFGHSSYFRQGRW